MKALQANHITIDILTIDGFLSPEDCDQLIDESEEVGYEAATIQTERGARLVKQVRNNQRVLFKDENLALQLWEKLSELAPKQVGNSKAIGLNELFRFYKYGSGERFRRHRDESYIRNETEASYYTFMIYLNDAYSGGETGFDNVIIKGKKGMALIFLHSLLHEGTDVTNGTKYVLRTDIMYRLNVV